jgi:hypothetical protein
MTGDRSPLEPFLSPEPPRSIEIRERWSGGFRPVDEIYCQQIEGWSATRAWIRNTERIDDREGPTLKLNVLFYVDETPVSAQFVQDSDGMHWAGSDRPHHDWFFTLMRSVGETVTVLYHRTERHCALFGDMSPYIYWDFKTAFTTARDTEDLDERLEFSEICVDIVSAIKNVDLAGKATARSGRRAPLNNRDEWTRAAYTAIRNGDPLLANLERMLPLLEGEGHWFWAAV